ncbi:AAA family ATPase [Paenibacillus hamazuiensis]|uniref:AAA family ATPase n=1 Tax=Paenibacillus hamazuiensis TaxID=2936508 RepID=UPI0020105EEE|nr:AAA family ATPase [Paenibacillus hamazuiensis]
MRLTGVDLRQYGGLRDVRLQTDASFTLVYGHNEAGKSTLMQFIRAVLFGFASRGQGGEGALMMLDEAGRRVRVERTAGAKGRVPAAGAVKLTYDDGTGGGDKELAELLGGVTPELFRSVFAFGLTELQELRTLQTDEVGSYLYSAGLGAGVSRIREAEKRLAGQMEQLYKPRGKAQPLNQAAARLSEIEAELRASMEAAMQYDSLRSKLADGDGHIAGLASRRGDLERLLQLLRSGLRLLDPWQRLQIVRARLEELPERDAFPEEAAHRLEQLEGERERLLTDLDRIGLKRQTWEKELQETAVPDRLPQEAEERLRHLLSRAGYYDEMQRDIIQLQTELERDQVELEQLLSRIDPSWNEAALAAFPQTVAAREQLRGFQAAFARLAEQNAAAEAEAAALLRDVQEAAAASAKQAERLRDFRQRYAGPLAAFDEAAAQAWKRELPSLSRLAADWRQAQQERRYAEEREAAERAGQEALREADERLRREAAASARRLAVTLALLALAVPAALLAAGRALEAALGFAALAVAAASAAVPWLRGPARPRRGRMPAASGDGGADSQLRRREAELRERFGQQLRMLPAMPEAAAASAALLPLGEDPEPAGAWLELLQQALQQHEEAAAEVRRLAGRLAELHEREQQLRERQRAAEAQRRQRETAAGELCSRWREWLAAAGLAAGCTPEAALEAAQLAEQAGHIARRRDKAAARLAALAAERSRFAEDAARLLGPAALEEPVLALKRWQERAEAAEQTLAARRLLEAQLREADEQSALLQEQLQRVEHRLGRLLEQAGAANAEQLRVIAKEQEERERLLQEKRQLEAMFAGWRTEDGANRLIDLLMRSDEAELRLAIGQAERQLAELEAELDAARDRRGRLLHEIERLKNDADHGRKLQQFEEQKAELLQLVSRWATLSVCSQLFAGAKRVYEKERQPAVLQRASAYFSRLTGGRYVRVVAPFEEQRLLAERSEGGMLETSELSRGTAEQLFLAMRFALVDEYANHVRLPLILDDILVNFDKERMSRSLTLLSEISRDHQVLLFTCHDHMREEAQRIVPGLHVIELEGQG